MIRASVRDLPLSLDTLGRVFIGVSHTLSTAMLNLFKAFLVEQCVFRVRCPVGPSLANRADERAAHRRSITSGGEISGRERRAIERANERATTEEVCEGRTKGDHRTPYPFRTAAPSEGRPWPN